jgi:HEAT repeats
MMQFSEDETDRQSPLASSELLEEALHAGDGERRLTAARALKNSGEEHAIPALITALSDQNPGVRWLAGEALIHRGAATVLPLLHALIAERPSMWLYEEAEHVLRHLQLPQFHGALGPVIEACEHGSRAVEVPVQAALALQAIERSG